MHTQQPVASPPYRQTDEGRKAYGSQHTPTEAASSTAVQQDIDPPEIPSVQIGRSAAVLSVCQWVAGKLINL